MNEYDITSIENTFKTLILNGGVSNKVYVNRPKSAPTAEDFVVVKVSGRVYDTACYGDGTVMVALYARNIANEKNGAKLSTMYHKLALAIPAEANDILIDTHPYISSDLADDYGFHARIITFNVTIKSV